MSYRRVGNTTGNAETDLHASQREAQAFNLRAQGYDFDEIAAKCGYANRSGAYKAYKRALARIPERAVNEMRETIFAQQMHALKCMSFKINKGDTFAVKEMTAIHDRMARLFGLDTPVVDAAALAGHVVIREYPSEWVKALPAVPEPVLQPEGAPAQ